MQQLNIFIHLNSVFHKAQKRDLLPNLIGETGSVGSCCRTLYNIRGNNNGRIESENKAHITICHDDLVVSFMAFSTFQ